MELYAFLTKPFIDIVQFFFILTFIGAIHEFAHAYAVKIYGGDVHDIGIALFYFTPAFYCDTTDSVLFPSKWHRLWVTTAGIYVEGFMLLGGHARVGVSYPDTLLHEIAFKTMLFTGVSTVFFNINPLIKIDGYYALSSVLEIPELREESFRYIGALVSAPRPAPPCRGPGGLPAQAPDLLDLRLAGPGLGGGDHALHRRPLLQLCTTTCSPSGLSCSPSSRSIGSSASACGWSRARRTSSTSTRRSCSCPPVSARLSSPPPRRWPCSSSCLGVGARCTPSPCCGR